MLPRGVQHMRASGSFGRFTLFHHLSHHPMTLAAGRVCWCFVCLFACCLLFLCFVFVCFLFCKCHGIFSNPPRVLVLDDRQGLTASSAMQ